MVIDTSALVAILAHEPEREAFLDLIYSADILRVSAAATLELTIVMSNKKNERAIAEIDDLLAEMRASVEAITPEQAVLARRAFLAYGRGRHKAKLNFGDCFTYALAMHLGEPLLYKGDDFARTDVRSALGA